MTTPTKLSTISTTPASSSASPSTTPASSSASVDPSLRSAGSAASFFDRRHPGLYQFLVDNQDWSSFARDLADRISTRGDLSPRQISAAESMRRKVEAKQQAASAPATPDGPKPPVTGFRGVMDALQHVQASGNAHPVLRFATPSSVPVRIRLNTYGQNMGSAAILYGEDKLWLGTIDASEASWSPTLKATNLPSADKADLWSLLGDIRKDALGTLAANGKELGTCGVCGRPLSDAESVARGIGPICADKLGL